MEVRQSHFPYCIKKTNDGHWIVLNRYYKPLGVTGDDFITYESHPTAFKAKITPAVAKKLSHNQSEDTASIYLYADGCIPTDSHSHMEAYLARLAVLAKIKHE